MARLKSILIRAVLWAALSFPVLATVGWAGLSFVWEQDRTADGAARIIEIKPGARIRTLATLLEQEGLVRSALMFELSARALAEGAVRAGEFELTPGQSMADIWDTVARGPLYLRQLTIPEGLTVRQIGGLLATNPYLTGKIDQLPPEGSLLPDSYAFEKGTSRAAILAIMANAMDRLKLDLGASDKDIILASIIEKETGLAGERNLISGVFHNRLNRGMKLQSDPTVVYAVSGGAGSIGRPLTRRDLSTRSPYNTYEVTGLPPTPIANPGRAAIIAAMNPEKTEALYFVADGKGGHAFAATLEDHNRNVAKWRRIERKRRQQGATGPVPSAP